MADTRISDLADGGSPQANDQFVVVRSATNFKVTVSAGSPMLSLYATTAQASAGASINTLMSPSTTKKAIQDFALTSAALATTAQAQAARQAASDGWKGLAQTTVTKLTGGTGWRRARRTRRRVGSS